MTKTLRNLTLAGLVLGLGLGASYRVNADENTQRGLVVGPAIHEVTGDRGGTYEVTVNVENDSLNETYKLTPEVRTFSSKDEDGTPMVVKFADTDPLKSWVTFAEKELTLAKGEKKDSKVRVTIPSEAQPGSYYFALTYSTQSQAQAANSASQVTINKEVAALLFVTVNGQVDRSVTFDSFTTDKQVYDPFFDGLTLNYKISLDGNAYLKPSGNVFVGNNLEKPDSTLNINPNNKIILPNSGRRFEKVVYPILDWPILTSNVASSSTGDVEEVPADQFKRSWFGTQDIVAKVIFVNSKGELEQKSVKTSVYFFPWKMLLIVGVAAAVIGGGAYLGYKALKKKSDK